MPGLLDTSVQMGRQATGLGEAASSMSAENKMRRKAERFAAQEGIGQAVGTLAGYQGTRALTKKAGQAAVQTTPKPTGEPVDDSSLGKLFGAITQHLYKSWLPQHDDFPTTQPYVAQPSIAPEPGLVTTPQEATDPGMTNAAPPMGLS